MAGIGAQDWSNTFTQKLLPAWNQHPRYLDSCGGTRSGKTYSILQMLIMRAAWAEKNHKPKTITSVVSETIPHLKRGAIRDFETIMRKADYWDDSKWNKTDLIYTFGNGGIIEFFSVDSPGKVHGPARDHLFINECQNIPYDIARQLFVRTSDRIILDYNPVQEFWVHTKIQPQDNCISIHSTYKDNNFLTALQVAEIESNKDDANWWKVYGLGEIGTLEGIIYDFEQIDSMPEDSNLKECYGLDFGFTNDPTAIVRLLVDTKRKIVYADERCYQTHLLNHNIASILVSEDMPSSVKVYADCAEPKSIEEISREGVNIVACDKDAPVKSDKLKFQLQWMQGWKFYFTKRSINLIKEARNYTWAKDKDGKPLNQPIDKWNHILDALRYALWSKFGANNNEGQYTISIR